MERVKEKVFRTASGEVLTEEDIEKIADEIESDEPVVFTAVRPVGRPPLDGNGASPRLSFRIPQGLYDAAAERAIKEERTVSALAREALEKYLAD
jgi:predicted HicB family RNase H-like nuclease